jgi:DNA-binding HxlR family transcriptional regulator
MHALNGSPAGQYRAGGRALSLFASPLNPLIIRALAEEPLRLAELRERVGCPAQTTLRGYLCDLAELGIVTGVERREMPYSVTRELTPQGKELLFVADVLQAWLSETPQGEIRLGTEPAKAVIKALTDGWGSTILRALASQPLSLTELDGLIADVSYPSLERRLSIMRITGQIEAIPSQGNGTPYAITDWARRSIAPLSAAGRWERAHLPAETGPVTWVEVEAAFLMALPLVQLEEGMEGECVLAADTREAGKRIAGVHVIVERGEVISCEAELKSEPPAFALGTATAWLDAVIEGQMKGLHVSGDRKLVKGLVQGLHGALF